MKRIYLLHHPLHPPLVHFPIALWAIALAWDLVFAFNLNPLWWQMAFWCLLAGCILAVLTAAAGLLDLLALPRRHPAFRLALGHLGVMLYVFAHECANTWVHARDPGPRGPWFWMGLVLSFSGALLVSLGAWLGGEMVYQEAVGTVFESTVRPDQKREP